MEKVPSAVPAGVRRQADGSDRLGLGMSRKEPSRSWSVTAAGAGGGAAEEDDAGSADVVEADREAVGVVQEKASADPDTGVATVMASIRASSGRLNVYRRAV